jgi:hypothetical protein
MRAIRKNPRRQRGWIMLVVMLLLLALSLSVTAYYTESEDFLYTGQSVTAYNIAALRAEQGVQEALSQIRSGQLNPVAVIKSNTCQPTAPQDEWTACITAPLGILGQPVPPPGAPDLTIPLQEGGGMQYQWLVFHPPGTGIPQNLYAIRSRGFYGYQGSKNLYVSEVEITVQIGSSGSGKCTNYDCS